MKTFLPILIVLTVCTSCNSDKDNEIMNQNIKSIFYSGRQTGTSSGIFLYPEKTLYSYSWGSCLASGHDSGHYELKNDTIYFTSVLKKLENDVNNGHNQITSLNDKKFWVKSDRIYFSLESGKYDPKLFWLKSGSVISLNELLDKDGNGEVTLYNEKNLPRKSGQFKNFKIYNGVVNCYDKWNDLDSTKIFEKGLLTVVHLYKPDSNQTYQSHYFNSVGQLERIAYRKYGEHVKDSIIIKK